MDRIKAFAQRRRPCRPVDAFTLAGDFRAGGLSPTSPPASCRFEKPESPLFSHPTPTPSTFGWFGARGFARSRSVRPGGNLPARFSVPPRYRPTAGSQSRSALRHFFNPGCWLGRGLKRLPVFGSQPSIPFWSFCEGACTRFGRDERPPI